MAGGRGVGGRSSVRFAPSARGGSNRSMNGSRSSRNGSMSSLRDPTALYRMLESGLDKGGSGGKASGRGGGGSGGEEGDQQGGTEHEAMPLTRLEEIRRAERLDKMYDAVRRWLRSNSNSPSNSNNNSPSSSENPVDPTLKHEAATHLGLFGMTALHLLCKLPNPPVESSPTSSSALQKLSSGPNPPAGCPFTSPWHLVPAWSFLRCFAMPTPMARLRRIEDFGRPFTLVSQVRSALRYINNLMLDVSPCYLQILS